MPPMPKWIENVTINLTFKNADMMTLLDKVYEETGITILREDAPIHANATFSFHGHLKDALDQIANSFDYTWVPARKVNKALLFKKRFRSPEEHPEWREKEMLHVAEQVCLALQSPLAISDSYGNTRDLLHLLYHKLSPQQLQFLYQGGKLSFQDLDTAQTLLLNQQIYCVALGGPTRAWQQLQARLTHLSEAKLVLQPSDGYKALTLLFPPPAGGDRPDAVIVRYYMEEDFAPNAPTASVAPVNMERPAPITVQTIASEAEKSAPLLTNVSVRMQGGRLANLLRAVSLRSGCKITAADYLQQQSFSLWTRGCSVRMLMELLAEQNEWEWNYTASRGINIARRNTFVPANLAEVSAAFLIALPPIYRHFLGWGVSSDDWLKETEDVNTQALRNIDGGNMIAMRNMVGKKAMYSDYTDPAMLRIWPTQPQKFSNHQELIYKDWTPQTKEAVLWSLMATALQGFFWDSRGLDVIEGRLTPYEKNSHMALLHLNGRDGKYGEFGYSSTSREPNGHTNTMGFFWELSHASAPLPPPLEEIAKRY